jgi:glycosyltransferase involved in cell wall biosynthesis
VSLNLCIIMPVLNEGDSLQSALQALQPMRQRGAELVVVDGGSTDMSWALARALAHRL